MSEGAGQCPGGSEWESEPKQKWASARVRAGSRDERLVTYKGIVQKNTVRKIRAKIPTVRDK